MDLKPQYTRITNYKKLVDRFITSQAKTSENPKEKNKGTIFALIEILNPWHPNAQIGQTIINTLTREYYRQSNSNELINFENALKKVNEKLVEITQRGETDWIGKINASLVLVANNKIHLAYTGKTKAYLLRSKKLLPIINPKETYTYNHPLKTFSSVVSGDLKMKDRIFFSTNLLFDIIDTKKLEQIASEGSIADTSSQIVSILKSRNTRQANCILIEMGLVDQADSQNPEAVYLDQEQFSVYKDNLKKSFSNIKDYSKNIGGWLAKSFGSTKKYYNEKIAPKGKELIDKSKKYTKKSTTKKPEIKKEVKTTISPEKVSKKSPNVNYYNKSSKKIILYLKKISDFLVKLFHKITNFLKNCMKPKNRSKTFIAIAILLLIIFITNIGYLKKINKNKENIAQTEETIKDMESRYDDASLALMTNDKEKANEILAELSQELNNLQYDESLNDKVNTLKEKIQEKLDEISNITRLTSPEYITEGQNLGIITIKNQNIIAIDTNNNQIFSKKDDTSSNLEEIAIIPTSDGLVKNISQDENNIYIYTDDKKLYFLEDDDLEELSNDDNDWQDSVAMANFADNIYLLDSENGQIYKYTGPSENYSGAEDYIDTNTIDIKESVDLTIDGYIYVLKKDGTIEKILLDQSENISPIGIPAPSSNLSNPKQIYTNENINSLYILDENRIIEIDKNGNYTNQYAFSNDITDITDFFIDPDSQTIYILNNNSIYKYNY